MDFLGRTYGGPTGVLYNGKPTGSKCSGGYFTFRVKGKTYRNHVAVWIMHNGPIPKGLIVDHEDRDRTNNLIGNLRLATRAQNRFNEKSRSATPNVRKHGNVWRVRIKDTGNLYVRSGFKTLEDAVSYAELLNRLIKGEFYSDKT